MKVKMETNAVNMTVKVNPALVKIFVGAFVCLLILALFASNNPTIALLCKVMAVVLIAAIAILTLSGAKVKVEEEDESVEVVETSKRKKHKHTSSKEKTDSVNSSRRIAPVDTEVPMKKVAAPQATPIPTPEEQAPVPTEQTKMYNDILSQLDAFDVCDTSSKSVAPEPMEAPPDFTEFDEPSDVSSDEEKIEEMLKQLRGE